MSKDKARNIEDSRYADLVKKFRELRLLEDFLYCNVVKGPGSSGCDYESDGFTVDSLVEVTALLEKEVQKAYRQFQANENLFVIQPDKAEVYTGIKGTLIVESGSEEDMALRVIFENGGHFNDLLVNFGVYGNVHFLDRQQFEKRQSESGSVLDMVLYSYNVT